MVQAFPKTSRTTQEVSMSRLIRVDEAADRLGLSPVTVRRMLSTGELPCVRPRPRAVRVREEDLLALMRIGYRPAPVAAEPVGA